LLFFPERCSSREAQCRIKTYRNYTCCGQTIQTCMQQKAALSVMSFVVVVYKNKVQKLVRVKQNSTTKLASSLTL